MASSDQIGGGCGDVFSATSYYQIGGGYGDVFSATSSYQIGGGYGDVFSATSDYQIGGGCGDVFSATSSDQVGGGYGDVFSATSYDQVGGGCGLPVSDDSPDILGQDQTGGCGCSEIKQTAGAKKGKRKLNKYKKFDKEGEVQLSRLVNEQTNEIRERILKKIMKIMEVDKETAILYRAALYRMTKKENPKIKSNLDRHLAMEKMTTKKNLKSISQKTLDEIEKKIEESKKRKSSSKTISSESPVLSESSYADFNESNYSETSPDIEDNDNKALPVYSDVVSEVDDISDTSDVDIDTLSSLSDTSMLD